MSKSVKILTTTLNAAAFVEALSQVATEIISAVTNGNVAVSTSSAKSNDNNNTTMNNHTSSKVDRDATSTSIKTMVIGTEPPCNVCAGLVQPSASHMKHAGPYAGVQTTIVRAILPRTHASPLPLRDILDVYHKAGINCTNDDAVAERSFAQAAQVAIAAAQQRNANRVTLVIKPASKYERLNEFFVRVCGKTIEGAGLSVDTMHTAQASNELILFPEKHGVFLVNDEPTCTRMQLAYAGVIGGSSIKYVTAEANESQVASDMFGGYSYTSVAYAVANTLRELGLAKEATRVEEAVGNARNYQHITESLESAK